LFAAAGLGGKGNYFWNKTQKFFSIAIKLWKRILTLLKKKFISNLLNALLFSSILKKQKKGN
jgi:hypothetical protein